MKKPVKLVYDADAAVNFVGVNTTFSPGFGSFTMISPQQPDWSETNPQSPAFIKNKEIAEQYRPITVNGEEFLSEKRESGALNLAQGDGISLEVRGDTLVVSATGGGNSGSECSCPDYVEGSGIDIIDNSDGTKTVAIEENSVGDEMISDVSITKLTQEFGEILILNGGSTNG